MLYQRCCNTIFQMGIGCAIQIMRFTQVKRICFWWISTSIDLNTRMGKNEK